MLVGRRLAIALTIRSVDGFLSRSLFTCLIPPYNYGETEFRGLDSSIQTGRYRLARCYFRMTIFRVAVDSGVVNW